jgi:hypothetical protein
MEKYNKEFRSQEPEYRIPTPNIATKAQRHEAVQHFLVLNFKLQVVNFKNRIITQI